MTLNLSELREMITKTKYGIDNEDAHQLLNIAEAAKRHSDSFHNAHGVLIVGSSEKQIEVNEAAERLDKLLEDVEIGDE